MTDVPVLLVCAERRRAALTASVRAAEGVRLVQVVTRPQQAPGAAADLQRGVLLLDAEVEGGAEALVHAVMSRAPVPVLVLGEGLSRVAADALLAAGAVEVRRGAGLEDLAARCRVLAGVGVVRRAARAERPRPDVLPATGTVLALGASTGGPPALATLLTGLRGVSVPVLVVQHIAADFLPGLASWLADTVPVPVSVARDGEALRPGEVHLAPGDRHLRLVPGGRLALGEEPVTLHRPSVDELFLSVAACEGAHGIGVLLTGMGRDGARGLLELRQAGGRTLVQDEATSTVFGMPRAALELGAAEQVLPLDALADAVLALLARVRP